MEAVQVVAAVLGGSGHAPRLKFVLSPGFLPVREGATNRGRRGGQTGRRTAASEEELPAEEEARWRLEARGGIGMRSTEFLREKYCGCPSSTKRVVTADTEASESKASPCKCDGDGRGDTSSSSRSEHSED